MFENFITQWLWKCGVLLLQLVFLSLCFAKSCWDRSTSNEKAFFTMAYNKYTIDLESITFEVETWNIWNLRSFSFDLFLKSCDKFIIFIKWIQLLHSFHFDSLKSFVN